MAEITIEPASTPRFGDVEHALTGGGDGGSCWCQWWMLRSKDWQSSSRDQRHEMLRSDLEASPPSGLVVYVDGEAAGWVKVSARPDQPRLARSRNLQASPEPFDDASVWAVTCFVVRRDHRGQGLPGACSTQRSTMPAPTAPASLRVTHSTQTSARRLRTTCSTARCPLFSPPASTRSPVPHRNGRSSRSRCPDVASRTPAATPLTQPPAPSSQVVTAVASLTEAAALRFTPIRALDVRTVTFEAPMRDRAQVYVVHGCWERSYDGSKRREPEPGAGPKEHRDR